MNKKEMIRLLDTGRKDQLFRAIIKKLYEDKKMSIKTDVKKNLLIKNRQKGDKNAF